MSEFNRKEHWENIYSVKGINEVSWYQPTPSTSLYFIEKLNTPKSAKIIDIGGGDSFLVDHLLDLGYTNVTVLDISEKAIERAKTRLGQRADQVNWIVSDVAKFNPTENYDLWHDRAAFHFLTDESEVERYVETAGKHVSKNGHVVIGTFSNEGPTKCSGIEIKQYSEASMKETFAKNFESVSCNIVNHTTPFDTVQNFIFCSFKPL